MKSVYWGQGFCTILVLLIASTAWAEPGWKGTIVARGEFRQQIESTPILERPYRPFHFYGNTIRREYYRGVAIPLPRDLVNGTRALVTRQ
jgi:hypothetical protein